MSAHTRAWSRAGRGERWHAADALAMALALQPAGVLESVSRPLAIETAGQHTRGATVVDWNRQGGAPDNVDILLRYDQARFERILAEALAAC
jgi:purine nucleosidase